MRTAIARNHTGVHYLIQQHVVVLPDLATEDAIHAFIYGLKPRLKGFVKAQA